MTAWHEAIGLLPFEWAQYEFMRNALAAAVLLAPLCGILGTLIVGNRMAFFADSIGHASLAGLAAAVLLGLDEPGGALVLFAACFAALLSLIKLRSDASSDTIMAAATAASVAAGVAVLSRDGGFSKFTRYLIGDVLGIGGREIAMLAALLAFVVIAWLLFFNRIMLVALEPALARSRGMNPFRIELLFAIGVAVVIAAAIPWVGLFIISALLVLPAATARNIARSALSYHLASVAIALVASLSGLFLSFELGTSAGATIVLVAAAIYTVTLAVRRAH